MLRHQKQWLFIINTCDPLYVFNQNGGEVRVTQASHDGGVDAIAFDDDAIRGGKFVIQAKRYNNVVPVSAVRDLYGTMIHEGATKGILVTTSSYRKESYDFAKDKPITLIDGQALLRLLNKYGYDNLTIRVLKKKIYNRNNGKIGLEKLISLYTYYQM